jgi:hypothetical protein
LGIVAGSAALNGLVKARNDRDRDAKIAEALAPFPDFRVSININDSLTVGGFLAAGELLISIIAFWSFIFLFLSSLANSRRNSKLFDGAHRRTEGKRGVQLFALVCWIFALLWTFASAVPSLDYNRNRNAKTKAWIGDTQVPPETVQALEDASGLESAYWVHGYVKFASITPWPLILFTIISTVLTAMAWRRTPANAVSYNDNRAAGAVGGRGGVETDRTSDSLNDEKHGVAKHAENSSAV